MTTALQQNLFELPPLAENKPKKKKVKEQSGTFLPSMRLPVHRWFRYSAGFSATWVKEVISERNAKSVLDPFVGSGTVCVAADEMGVPSFGVESHPFVYRLARGKIAWGTNAEVFNQTIQEITQRAIGYRLKSEGDVPALMSKCYSDEVLRDLLRIRAVYEELAKTLPAELRDLVFLAINAILRVTSHVGTAQWQYVLPNKRKAKVISPAEALAVQAQMMIEDMKVMQRSGGATKATLIQGDARILDGVPRGTVDLVITSPPYPNNYDYADATRLEMTFWGEVNSWGDLHEAVRKFLVRSSSQHTSKERLELGELLIEPVIAPIHEELAAVCRELDEVRGTKGGNKTYHTMIAAYYIDMGKTLNALRRVVRKGGEACLVIGDSAPYGVYAPADTWIGSLALAAGFKGWEFEKIRDRNIKWKNRKHTVPLKEGRLWIRG